MSKILEIEKRLKELEQPKMFVGIIYKYTNLINGKIYIGQTINGKKRKNSHNYKINHSSNTPFHNAVRKYGWENFKYEIIFKSNFFNRTDANFILTLQETYFIIKYNSTNRLIGYNVLSGGQAITTEEQIKIYSENRKGENNHFFGKHHSEETKKKLSEANKGRKVSEEVKEELRLRNLGNKYCLGRKDSEETKEKRRISCRNSENTKKISKAVIQLTLDGKFIKRFNSIKEAVRFYNLKSDSAIGGCARGTSHCKSAFNSLWIFEEEYNPNKKYSYNGKKSVIQLDLDGNYIKEWISIKDASENLGICLTTIKGCCNGYTKSAKGFKWIYAEDYYKNKSL